MNNEWLIAVKTFSSQEINPKKRVLFVITSHDQFGDTHRKTGLHLGEVTHAYRPLIEAGFEIDFVSPKGGITYMYGTDLNDPNNIWFIQHPTAYYRFLHAKTPSEIDPKKYAAIYFVGGHGTMWDLPNHAQITKLTTDIYEQGGVVAGVCHGPSGLINVKLNDGSYLVDGKQLTSFTNSEEKAAQADEIVPFLLESKLKERGALFVNEENWQENVVVDERLVTGQNPASAKQVALEIIRLVNK
ncbi:MAG: type 1 glutamine amidotransferase domain-containing protein [Bacteroidota bacterium]